MSGLVRERWARVGPFEVGLSLPVALDRRLTKSGAIQRVLKPLRRATRRTTSRADAALPADIYEPLSARRPQPSDIHPEARALIDRVARIDWYHTIDLKYGVVTPGFVDHRDQLSAYQLPESLAGKRCLDVATFDGFWAFEMEKRGAAEVVAIDVARFSEIDMPAREREKMLRSGQDRETGAGFRLAHDVLGSRVTRKTISVYDLSPELIGTFDFVFLSDLLLHLRDPQLALDRVRSVCRGTFYLADVCHLGLEPYGDACLAEYPLWVPGQYVWWLMGISTIERMMRSAGFETVDQLARFALHVPGAPLSHPQRGKVLFRGVVNSSQTEGSTHVEPPAQ